MKNFHEIGSSLSRDEQRKISGGDLTVTTCRANCVGGGTVEVNCSGLCRAEDGVGAWCLEENQPPGEYCPW